MKNPVTSYNTSTVTCDNFKLYSLKLSHVTVEVLYDVTGFFIVYRI